MRFSQRGVEATLAVRMVEYAIQMFPYIEELTGDCTINDGILVDIALVFYFVSASVPEGKLIVH